MKNCYHSFFIYPFFFQLDICCRADTAEVELVSLIEEHIPHYKLRADTLTEFCGKYGKFNNFIHINFKIACSKITLLCNSMFIV